ncbi:MAG TPA: hypothetical protein VD931_05600 [Baekduia sp.]|nr:hypothetical protein [Baekduia sp.]
MTTAAHRLKTAAAAALGSVALIAATGAADAHAAQPCSGLPGSDNGQTYAHGTTIIVQSIRTGAKTKYQCQDGTWVKVTYQPRTSFERPPAATTVEG